MDLNNQFLKTLDIADGRATLHLGDCIDVMRTMPDNSVDSIVTDPPYELTSKGGNGGFMGKKWDATGIAHSVEMWSEAFRVLKPGGHLLAFSGSRTYHRMTCAIEDAGFDVRDQIMWIYGSGFPKSLDVSKSIDKRGGNAHLTAEIGAAIKAAREVRGMSAAECDRLFCGGTTNWSWFEGRPNGQRAPTMEQFSNIAAAWPEMLVLSEKVESAEREVLGTKKFGIKNGAAGGSHEYGLTVSAVDVTAPSTANAKLWQGWGTALKPAHEPICVARKPLIGTVASNVLAHGTGALNIDGCRVTSSDEDKQQMDAKASRNPTGKTAANVPFVPGVCSPANDLGRWPANVIHDGSDLVEAEFALYGSGKEGITPSRFFYSAKTSKKDRDEGLEGFDLGSNMRVNAPRKGEEAKHGSKLANIHPTVKPTALMAYLCRLVTPPGGIVLDLFMGSGSTGKAAVQEGFQFIGIDMTQEYVEIAAARITAASQK